MGLFDSWGDFFSGLKDMASSEANARISQQYGSDHIYAQEEAGREMARILARFNNSAPHNFADVLDAEASIMRVADRFSDYAATFNTARASRGAAELTALAKQIVSDLRADAGPGGAGVYPGISQIPAWAWGLGALGLVVITTKGRRR